jgi:hypothetical protein
MILFMKYEKRPCNAIDCDNWINEPGICKKCLNELFTIELDCEISE